MQVIKRILNPIDLCKVLDDLQSLFLKHQVNDNELFNFDIESIKRSFTNTKILNWDFFVWASFNGENYDGIICFLNEKNVFLNKQIFSQCLWLSKNPNMGYKLFSTAIKFAKEKDFKYIRCKTYFNNEKNEKVKSFYEKIGLLKETETYICEL
jgi:predicted enzyme involved in methoxymalonyl-ACP biosynthesis